MEKAGEKKKASRSIRKCKNESKTVKEVVSLFSCFFLSKKTRCFAELKCSSGCGLFTFNAMCGVYKGVDGVCREFSLRGVFRPVVCGAAAKTETLKRTI